MIQLLISLRKMCIHVFIYFGYGKLSAMDEKKDVYMTTSILIEVSQQFVGAVIESVYRSCRFVAG